MILANLAHEVGAVSYTKAPMRAVHGVSMSYEQLEQFAKRIAAHERERCAKVCESMSDESGLGEYNRHASAIRALGDEA